MCKECTGLSSRLCSQPSSPCLSTPVSSAQTRPRTFGLLSVTGSPRVLRRQRSFTRIHLRLSSSPKSRSKEYAYYRTPHTSPKTASSRTYTQGGTPFPTRRRTYRKGDRSLGHVYHSHKLVDLPKDPKRKRKQKVDDSPLTRDSPYGSVCRFTVR